MEWLVAFGEQVREVELQIILATATMLGLTSVRNQHVSERARANVLEAMHNLPIARLKAAVVKARLDDLRSQNEEFVSRYRLTSKSFMCFVLTLAFFAVAGAMTARTPQTDARGDAGARQLGEPPAAARSNEAPPPASTSSTARAPDPQKPPPRAREVIGGMCAVIGTVLGLLGLAFLILEFRRGPKTLTSNNVTLETLTAADFMPVDKPDSKIVRGYQASIASLMRLRVSGR